MRTPCSQLDPSRGVLVVLAASSTPGVARTSSCNSCWNSAQRWGGKLDCQYPRKPTVMPPSRMPGSNVIKLRKLRTKSSAATSRTSETEIWVTTIRRRTSIARLELRGTRLDDVADRAALEGFAYFERRYVRLP